MRVTRPQNTTLAQAVLSALFVAVVALHSAGVFRIAAIDRVESWFYDAWLKQTAQAGLDDRIRPWRRRPHTRLP